MNGNWTNGGENKKKLLKNHFQTQTEYRSQEKEKFIENEGNKKETLGRFRTK